MCGIAGFIGKKKININLINQTLYSMERRGPDNQSFKKCFIILRYIISLLL